MFSSVCACGGARGGLIKRKGKKHKFDLLNLTFEALYCTSLVTKFDKEFYFLNLLFQEFKTFVAEALS